MGGGFDPYRKWLGIPEECHPPTHYELLGIAPDERDADVIHAAVIRQSTYVRNFQKGPHGDDATRLLNEIAAAEVCLTDAKRRTAYDAQLPQRARAAVPVVTPPISAPPLPAPPQFAPPSQTLPASPPVAFSQPQMVPPWGVPAPYAESQPWTLSSSPVWSQPYRSRPRHRPNWWLWGSVTMGSCLVALLVVAGVLAFRSRGNSMATQLPFRAAREPPQPSSTNTPAPLAGVREFPDSGAAVPLSLDATKAHTRLIPLGGNDVGALAFSPDSRRVAVARYQLGVVLLDVASGNRQVLLEGPESYRQFVCCAFSPTGRLLVTGDDWGCRVWKADEAGVFQHVDKFRISSGPPYCLAIDANEAFAICGLGRSVRQWDLRTGEVVNQWDGFENTVTGCAFVADGTGAVATDGWQVVRIDLTTGRRTSALDTGPQPGLGAVSADGRYWAQRRDDVIAVWDLGTRETVASFDVPPLHVVSQEEGGPVFSPDCKTLFCRNGGKMFSRLDVTTQQSILIDTKLGESFASSNDGRFLAYFSHDGVVVIELPLSQ